MLPAPPVLKEERRGRGGARRPSSPPPESRRPRADRLPAPRASAPAARSAEISSSARRRPRTGQAGARGRSPGGRRPLEPEGRPLAAGVDSARPTRPAVLRSGRPEPWLASLRLVCAWRPPPDTSPRSHRSFTPTPRLVASVLKSLEEKCEWI